MGGDVVFGDAQAGTKVIFLLLDHRRHCQSRAIERVEMLVHHRFGVGGSMFCMAGTRRSKPCPCPLRRDDVARRSVAGAGQLSCGTTRNSLLFPRIRPKTDIHV